ncbi:MAG: hypothetical protein ACON5A_02340 [Candidatus Comchoanobacterales bacterium]
MEDIIIAGLLGLWITYFFYETFMFYVNFYETDEWAKKESQVAEIVKISDLNDDATFTINSLEAAAHNFSILEAGKFKFDKASNISNILKKRDEHLRVINAKEKELKLDNISDDTKSQLNNDIERLTGQVDALTNEFFTIVEGSHEMSVSDWSLVMVQTCLYPLIWGKNDDTKHSKLIEPEEIKRLASELELSPEGFIGVDEITGKQYLLLYNSCSASVDYLYDGILNNKGFSATDQSRIDLNLSDETIQRFKDAVKDE